MGKSTPQPPAAPDPTVVAGAQSAANIETATAQQRLNQVGATSPYGSVLWQADPSQPGGYTQNTTFSPSQQGLYDATTGAQQQALDIAGQQIGRVGSALGQGFDLSQQPSLQYGVHGDKLNTTLPQTPGQQTTFDQGQGVQGQLGPQGQIQTGFNPGQAVQGQVNPTSLGIQGQVGNQDINQSVQNVQNAYWQQALSRLDPLYNQQQDQLNTRLANQGISQNNSAYGNVQDTFNRGRNDAYLQALFGSIGAGANEQNVLFGQQLAQGNFANAAQGQQYGQNLSSMQAANQAAAQQYAQNLGQAQFGNQAQQQGYEQALGAGQFANQAAAQQYMQNQGAADFANQANQAQFGQNLAGAEFGNQAIGQQFNQDIAAAAQQNAARNQGVQEQAYQQNLPLNQFNSLMSSSQVQAPNGINYTPSSVAPTDVTGAYALQSQAQQAAYQAQMQQQSALLGGLSQLGGAALGMFKFSDRRLKRDIERVGTWKGHNLYSFRYLWDNEPQFGVMADEVMHTGAVHNVGGFLAVDYAAL